MTLFGLIGKTLKHSFSKQYFTEKFARESIDSRYELFELADIGELPDLLAREPELNGLNVTIPYKEVVIPFLDSLSPAAEEIGAVNTIQFVNGKLQGHNTDVIGFEESLRQAWTGDWPEGALILGTGGAAKAVRFVLQNLGIANVLIASRQPSAQDQVAYADLGVLDWQQFRIVVNSTPLGTFPDTESKPDLPYELFSPDHLAFDLVYNPAKTAFMEAAASQGAATQNGYDMLVGQAEAAWAIWNQ